MTPLGRPRTVADLPARGGGMRLAESVAAKHSGLLDWKKHNNVLL
jgi:hypothetical protein